MSRTFGDSFNKEALCSLMQKCIFHVLSVGPIPNHIAFIMDGNKRCDRNYNLNEGAGHQAGFLTLMSKLKYCYELGVKYVTIYAFSIENFKLKPQEVEDLMDLMHEKIESLLKEESIMNNYGVRVHFVGNLHLFRDSIRLAAEKDMAASTKKNDKVILLVCLAYTATDEIVHAVKEACDERHPEFGDLDFKKADSDLRRLVGGKENSIKSIDIEKHLYTFMAPDIDILV